MRVGGIVSGMDIEAMVNKLMEAERMPLNRMYQQQTTLEWKRDAFRDINSKLLELDNMMLDMKLSTSYKPKVATSSQESAVTATASSNASNGSYEIEVTHLASNAINYSTKDVEADVSFEEYIGEDKSITFKTFNEDGTAKTHTLKVEEGDNLSQVLKKIGEVSEGRVRAFYDENSKKVVLETTRTGSYNTGEDYKNSNGKKPEIYFDEESSSFFENVLGLKMENETGGENAVFTYNNGLEITSKNNHYTLNGITFEFNNVTEGNARITVSTDVEQSFDNIMNFVEKYNEAIEVMNTSQLEKKNRDFPPLTDEQKEEMTEDQIKKWEEKAKSGILRGESTIKDGMYTLRQSLQSVVETGGEYTLLSHIAITTTKNYLDGGKLEVNEEKLKAALRENPDDVYKLFSNSSNGNDRGLIHRFDDALDNTRKKIIEKAGNSSHALDNYLIGKEMKQLNERVSSFERRMIQVEQRYWNQFTQMEKAISQLNQQSSYLFSQFGGGM